MNAYIYIYKLEMYMWWTRKTYVQVLICHRKVRRMNCLTGFSSRFPSQTNPEWQPPVWLSVALVSRVAGGQGAAGRCRCRLCPSREPEGHQHLPGPGWKLCVWWVCPQTRRQLADSGCNVLNVDLQLLRFFFTKSAWQAIVTDHQTVFVN